MSKHLSAKYYQENNISKYYIRYKISYIMQDIIKQQYGCERYKFFQKMKNC